MRRRARCGSSRNGAGRSSKGSWWRSRSGSRRTSSSSPRVQPTGSVYLGTFATIFSTEKHAGAVRTFVELDSYGAMDTAAAAAKDQSSEYGRLIAELTDFFDEANAADWSTGLYKAMVDATVWDTA